MSEIRQASTISYVSTDVLVWHWDDDADVREFIADLREGVKALGAHLEEAHITRQSSSYFGDSMPELEIGLRRDDESWRVKLIPGDWFTLWLRDGGVRFMVGFDNRLGQALFAEKESVVVIGEARKALESVT